MTIQLGTTEFWDGLRNDPAALAAKVCTIDMANLDETLQQHASLHAWVSATYEVAKIHEHRAKWEVTKAEATVRLQLRTLPEPSGKLKTEKTLDAEVEVSPEVQAAQLIHFDKQETSGALKAMTESLEDRLQMLIQIAAKQRATQKDY